MHVSEIRLKISVNDWLIDIFVFQEWSFSQVWVHDPQQTEQRQHAGGDSPQHGV